MIVPMKRLTLVALKADEEAILQALQRTGTVEVISQADVSDDKTGDEQLLSQVQRFESAAQLLQTVWRKAAHGPEARDERGGAFCVHAGIGGAHGTHGGTGQDACRCALGN